MEEWWSRLFQAPRSCWFCSTPVRALPHMRIWEQICVVCQEQFQPIHSPSCHVCGRLKQYGGEDICADCILVPPPRRVYNRSVVEYTPWTKQIIGLFKYNGKEQLAHPLGSWMAEVFNQTWRQKKIQVITYVPLHPDRLRQRGFNQVELLAKQMSKHLRLPCIPLLERHRLTCAQSKRGRQERLHSLEGAFYLQHQVNPDVFGGKRILIVDDVYTTGSTIRECAHVLCQEGVSQVFSITFAR